MRRAAASRARAGGDEAAEAAGQAEKERLRGRRQRECQQQLVSLLRDPAKLAALYDNSSAFFTQHSMCLGDLQELCSNDPDNEEAAEALRLAIAHTTKSWTAAKEDTSEYSEILSEILNKERATGIYLQVCSSALSVFVMIAFQAGDLTQDAAKTIFSHVTWPESRNFLSR